MFQEQLCMGVNHLHAKLYPLLGIDKQWKPIPSNIDTYFNTYEGFVSSHNGPKISDTKLKTLLLVDIIINNLK